MFTWRFWEQTLERAIKATVWGLLAGATGEYALPFPDRGFLTGVLYYGAACGLLSLAGSILSTGAGNRADPALPLPLPRPGARWPLSPPPTDTDSSPPASPQRPEEPAP